MAFDRTLDPERREALKQMRRRARLKRREARAADPLFVAAEKARKQAQKYDRHAAYVAAKARRAETDRKPRSREPEPGRDEAPRAASHGAPGPSSETSAPAGKSNVIAFRRRA